MCGSRALARWRTCRPSLLPPSRAIASTDAVLSIPAVKEGVVADLGPMRLARLIGASKAKYLCLLGRRFSAKEGLELGILHEVVEPGELQQHVLNLTQE